MKYEIVKIYHGDIEDESQNIINLFQLCEKCKVSTVEIIELVNEGVIIPLPVKGKRLRFELKTLERVKKAKRLQKDLELNMNGVSLTMQLLDRIDELERILKRNTLRFHNH